MFILNHNFWTRNARKSIKGLKDSDSSLVSNENFSETLWPRPSQINFDLNKDWGCVILREIDFLLKICWSIPCLHPSWKVHTWNEEQLHSKIQLFLANIYSTSPTPNTILKLFAGNWTSANVFPSLTCLLCIYFALPGCTACEGEHTLNHCQKVLNRVALRLCRGGLTFWNLIKTPLIYTVSYFNFRGFGALFEKPP